MATKLNLEIIVDDKGSAVMKAFGQNAEGAFKQTEAAVKPQKGMLDELKNNWVTTSAAVVGAWMTVNKAVQYMDMGAKAIQVESSFKIMAESSGVNADVMVSNMKKATKETIDDSDMMQKAIRLMTDSYNPAQIERFANVVVTSSQVSGKTAAEAYELLADSIATKMPKAMIRMGAVTKEQMKLVNEAVAAGADEMSLYELAMANLELKQLQLKGTQDAETIAMQRFHATVNELTEILGKGLLWVAQGVISAFQLFSSVCMTVTGGVFGIIGGVKELIASFIELTGGPKEYSEAWRKSSQESIQYSKDMGGAALDLADKATKSGEYQIKIEERATKAALDAGKAKVDARLAAMQADIDAKKAAEAAVKAAEAYAKAYEKLEQEIEKTIADRKKYETGFYEWKLAEIEVSLREYEKAGLKEVDIARLKNEKIKNLNLEIIELTKEAEGEWMLEQQQRSDKEKQQAADLLQSYATVYGGIAIRSKELYNIQIRLIELQKEKFIQTGVEEVAAAAWAAQQQENKWIEQAEAGNKFFDGMKAGYLRMQQELVQWGRVGSETFKATANAMSKSFSDIFFDGLTGKLKTLGDYFTAFYESILRSFTNMIGQMAAQKVIAYFTTSWDASAGAGAINAFGKLLGFGSDWLDFGSASPIETGSDITQFGDIDYMGPEWADYYGWQGGPVGYGYGGKVGGYASHSGDHPGNDTVTAALSPGEYVIPRTSVNPATIGMLEYIRKNHSVPGYAEGGIVTWPQQTSRQEYDPGFATWNTVLNAYTQEQIDLMQMLSDTQRVFGVPPNAPVYYAGQRYPTIIDALKAGMALPTAGWEALPAPGLINTDPTGIYGWTNIAYYGTNDITGMGNEYVPLYYNRAFGAPMPHYVQSFKSPGGWIGPLEMLMGIAVPATVGIGGYLMAPAAVAGAAGEGALGAAAFTEGYGAAGAVAATTYEAGALEAALAYSLSDLASMALDWAEQQAIKQAIKYALSSILRGAGIGGAGGAGGLGGSGLDLKLTGWGNTEGLQGTLSNLNGIVGQNKAFSAANGLDYVPRDNFMVNTHKGEAILTKEEAAEWRGNKPSIGEIRIYLDGQEVEGRVKIIADGVVVERNRRGINPTMRAYN